MAEATAFCPVCGVHVGCVHLHLIHSHGTKPGSEEHRILCKLGRDQTPLDGVYNCPVREETGCTAITELPTQHLRSFHGHMSTDQINRTLRPLRYQVAIKYLRDLRASGTNLVTSIDLV